MQFINSEQGLNGREVDMIMQDSHGFMWFMTDNALNRYDGYTFRSWSYDPKDPDALVPGSYWGMKEGKNGTLWIGSAVKGLYSFDLLREKFTHYLHQPGNSNSLTNDYTWALASESDGTIWIGTVGGLDKYGPGAKTFTHFVHRDGDSVTLSDDEIFCIVLDEKNNSAEKANLFLINKKLGIDCFSTKSGKVLKHFDFPFPKSEYRWGGNPSLNVTRINGNVIWIGSNDNGIYGFNILTEQFIHIKTEFDCNNSLHVNGFYPVLEDHNGNLWTMNDLNDLIYYDRAVEKFYYYRIDRQMASFVNYTSDFFEDKGGTIWLGTQNGLLTIDTKQKQFYHHNEYYNVSFSLPENCVMDIQKLNREPSSFYDNAVNIFTGNTAKIFPSLPTTIYGQHVPPESIYKDSKGNFWLTGDFGIVSYNPSTRRTQQYEFHHPDPVTEEWFSGVVEDLKGRYWAANILNGLYEIDTLKKSLNKFKIEDEALFSSNDYFETIFRDSKGIIYLSRRENGFITFNPDSETFTIYHHDAKNPSTVSSETATVFHDGKNELIWFGTLNAGLGVFNPATGKFRSFTTADGLPQNFVASITEDKRGNYWLGTHGGISEFRPPDNPFADSFKIDFRNYNVSDGLSSNICSNNSAVCGPDGTLYFGTQGGGLIYFNPDDLKDNDFIPPVYITDLSLMNKIVSVNDSNSILKSTIEFTRELLLNYKQNTFSLTFASLNFIHPEKNQYAYKLEGLDHDWIYTDASKRFATYTNLNPGEYVFKVKASNNDGVWNETPTELKITITPPFWQTTWFKILVGLALLSAVYGFYRYRIGQILLLQRIRNKIAADLHDDIGSTLNSISVYSEVARDPSKQDRALNMIGESSRKIIESMSDIVWTINPENDTFDKIIFRMSSLAHNLLSAKKIECSFKSDESLNEITLPMEKRRNFYLIFKEALNNLVKYSNATRASVLVSQGNQNVTFIVRDNGVGFDSSLSYNGNGLINMKRRAQEINASLFIESSPGNGTSIELSLKL
ncbi:MAG TPA: two-component regulator propeller domain-containing protein [Chitinophagales bacterium]|nr:two-component regulator propeller domain-containing protein [Chitinophagales bacterium]